MRSLTSRDTGDYSSAMHWAAIAGVVLATAAAYANSLGGPFIYDDNVWITWNPSIRHLWPIWDVLSARPGSAVYGRPILSLSLALNHAVGGDNPAGYHAANLAIHIFAALALYGIVGRTLSNRPARYPTQADRILPACAVAVLWAVHPLQTESVTYVIQRAESLMGLFYLLTLYCFIRGSEASSPRVWLMLSVLACALGMATKEVMATAPLVVLAYDRTFVAGSFRSALRLRWRFYLGLCTTWTIVVLQVVGLSGRGVGFSLGYTWWSYGLTECWVVIHYLLLALWPYPLVFEYGTDIVGSVHDTIPWAAALLVLAAAGFLAFLRRLFLGFAAVWFFVVLSPTSSIVPVAFEPMAESRMYLPLAAVVAVVVTAAWSGLGRRSLPILGAAAVALGIGTHLRNIDYRSEISIWSDTVLRRPTNPRAHLALGSALALAERNEEAARQFEETLQVDPGDFQARRNLGLALYHMGRVDDALAQYRRIAPLSPDSAPLHYDIGLALDRAGRTDEAIGEYRRALAIDASDGEARNNLGSALFRTGQFAPAAIQYAVALTFLPDSAPIHYNLGMVLAEMGGHARAIAEYREAIRLKPGYVEAHNNLGSLLEQSGNAAEAASEFREALRIRPDYAPARSNLDRLGPAPK